MNLHRNHGSHTKHFFWIFALCTSFLLTGCGNADTNGTQARTDLTAEHVRGLYSGMKRNEIEDLLGGSDKSLAEKESVEVYSLADGTTAILRYREDTLMSAYLRDKDNVETSLFGQDASNLPGINGVNDTNSSLDSNESNTMNNNDTNLDSTYTPNDAGTTENMSPTPEDSSLNNAMDSINDTMNETNETESR